MGTNYYFVTGDETAEECPHCGHEYTKPEEIHIGKSSAGWCFSLHVYPENNILTLSDWIEIWEHSKSSSYIKNEYGDKIPTSEMLANIADRGNWPDPNSVHTPFSWYEKNSAEPGLKNLARHKIDGKHCIGHGDGTWDYIVGEFS
jgi:hypothetical protein